jgi:hypothetical protein
VIPKNEIVIYNSDDNAHRIEVNVDDETVWLSQQQMAALFNKSKQNISLHINNCYKEKELEKNSTVKYSLSVQKEGNRIIRRKIELYNLDVIISVGYRIKSKQGVQFRIWATRVIRDYLMKGYTISKRIDRIEDKIDDLQKRVGKIDVQLNLKNLPTQGIFFDGQVFDAYQFCSGIIKTAKKSIILIDNYVNEITLMHLSKKHTNVEVLVLCKNESAQLKLDVEKANIQYGKYKLKYFDKSHDRFLIIDEKEVYHLGASLKDIGKKWCAFTKLHENTVDEILNKILKICNEKV